MPSILPSKMLNYYISSNLASSTFDMVHHFLLPKILYSSWLAGHHFTFPGFFPCFIDYLLKLLRFLYLLISIFQSSKCLGAPEINSESWHFLKLILPKVNVSNLMALNSLIILRIINFQFQLFPLIQFLYIQVTTSEIIPWSLSTKQVL